MFDCNLRTIFELALQNLCASEGASLTGNVSEQNICGRLAMYLEPLARQAGFQDYFADVEYNRKQEGAVKTILNGENKVIRICCDLLLHSRGEVKQRDNLVAVEMKKAGRPAQERVDNFDRLMALTKASYDDIWSADGKTLPEHVCGYELGAFVEINRKNRVLDVQYFIGGKPTDATTLSF